MKTKLIPSRELATADIPHPPAETMSKARLFDNAIVGNAQEAVDFITNVLESSTEYSVIGKDLEGKILLWNEARAGFTATSRKRS